MAQTQRQRLRRTLLFFFFLIFPFTFIVMSPYLTVLGSADRIVSAGLLFWMIVFLLSFVTGRAFCGYACPLGAEQMLIDLVFKKPLVRIRWLPFARWVFWAGWGGVTLLLAVRAGGYERVDLLYHIGGFPFPLLSYVIFYSIVLSVLLISLLLGRRAFCAYFCFFSPLMMIGTRLKNALRYPSLHLEAEKGQCNQCRRCNIECPRSLDVAGMVGTGDPASDECILCGACVDTCPKGVLRYGWWWKVS